MIKYKKHTCSLLAGQKAPLFTGIDQNGNEVKLEGFIGKKIIIYFYPKDNSWGCTKQACSFQESQQDFLDLDCTVIWISSDSVLSHKTFSDERHLKFMLLSDIKDEVRTMFGVPASFFGLIKGRVTYIVDKNGIVQGVYNSQVNATNHIPKAIEIIKSIK